MVKSLLRKPQRKEILDRLIRITLASGYADHDLEESDQTAFTFHSKFNEIVLNRTNPNIYESRNLFREVSPEKRSELLVVFGNWGRLFGKIVAPDQPGSRLIKHWTIKMRNVFYVLAIHPYEAVIYYVSGDYSPFSALKLVESIVHESSELCSLN